MADSKYVKCIKRVDNEKAFKEMEADIKDYGIPTKWNEQFDYGNIDQFLAHKELKYFCPIKFYREEDFQKLQECNFLFNFVPSGPELTQIISEVIPQS